jgi:hypothetical protein
MNPDYIIENYWLNFKASMINFYNISKIPSRPIDKWSDELNIMQSLKQYMEIEYNIYNYISLYAIDVIRFQSHYHIDILATNIKRWKNISSENNIIVISRYNNIVFLLLDIYHSLLKNYNNDDVNIIHSMFNAIELYIIYEDFTVLIRYAIDYNKPGILDKIKTKYDINDMILRIYNVDVTHYTINNNSKISGKKIIQIINMNN